MSTIKNVMANNLPTEKKANVVSMLCEGSSIRAIERITGVNRNTTMNSKLSRWPGVRQIIQARPKMRNIKSEEIQIDEIWGFVGAKRGNARKAGMHGDVWTYISLERDTKLIPSFWVGQRTM